MAAESDIKRKRKQREGMKVIVRFFEAFNNRDTETMMELLGDEHVDHTFFGSQPVKPEAVARAIAGMVDTFPDWVESIDEIIPKDDGETFVVRQTGRGTQEKRYLKRDPNGQQIAAVLTTTLRIVDGKIVEYRSQYPFREPWEETINAAPDLDDARAEQGGVATPSAEVLRTFEEYAEGYIGDEEVKERTAALAADAPRCQALLAENMRRCQNRAVDGSLYCAIHQDAGGGESFGAPV
jgi:predicted ester cyclase